MPRKFLLLSLLCRRGRRLGSCIRARHCRRPRHLRRHLCRRERGRLSPPPSSSFPVTPTRNSTSTCGPTTPRKANTSPARSRSGPSGGNDTLEAHYDGISGDGSEIFFSTSGGDGAGRHRSGGGRLRPQHRRKPDPARLGRRPQLRDPGLRQRRKRPPPSLPPAPPSTAAKSSSPRPNDSAAPTRTTPPTSTSATSRHKRPPSSPPGIPPAAPPTAATREAPSPSGGPTTPATRPSSPPPKLSPLKMPTAAKATSTSATCLPDGPTSSPAPAPAPAHCRLGRPANPPTAATRATARTCSSRPTNGRAVGHGQLAGRLRLVGRRPGADLARSRRRQRHRQRHLRGAPRADGERRLLPYRRKARHRRGHRQQAGRLPLRRAGKRPSSPRVKAGWVTWRSPPPSTAPSAAAGTPVAVFSTKEPLVTADADSAQDVYERVGETTILVSVGSGRWQRLP